jgi:preprotein translocase subunit Sec61beta
VEGAHLHQSGGEMEIITLTPKLILGAVLAVIVVLVDSIL